MGLSDEERFNGIVYCISDISKIPKITQYGYEKINSLKNKFWIVFGKCHHIKSDWFFGGELDSDYFNPCSLVGAAFSTHLPQEEFPYKTDSYWDYLSNFLPRVDKLAENDGRYVVKLIQLTERINRFIFRYKDAFAKKFKYLADHIAKLQGAIYNIFQQDEKYFKAYLGSRLIHKALTYDEKDIINCWFMDKNLHHNIKITHLEVKELLDLWKETRSQNKLSLDKRLEIIHLLIDGDLHWEVDFKSNIRKFNEYNKASEEKISILNYSKLYGYQCKRYIDKKCQELTNPYKHYDYLTNEYL